MEITQEMRERAQTLLGDAAKDMDAPTLLSAVLTFGETAVDQNIDLNQQVTELSAAATDTNTQPNVVELSAATRRLVSDGIAAKVAAAADKLNLSAASREALAGYFAADDVVNLSASDEGSAPMKVLDLLASLEVTKLSQQEKTPAQVDGTLLLSREAAASTATPFDDEIQRITGK